MWIHYQGITLPRTVYFTALKIELLLDVFYYSGDPLAAAYTGRYNAVFFIEAFHVIG